MEDIIYAGLAGTLGLVVWGIKSLISHQSSKSLAESKSEDEISLETHRANLNLRNEQTLKAHEKEKEVIGNIYAKINSYRLELEKTCVVDFNELCDSKEEYEEKQKRILKKASIKGEELESYYINNKLYLREDTCKLIQCIIKELNDSLSIKKSKYNGILFDEYVLEFLRLADSIIMDKVPNLQNNLEMPKIE